MADLQKQLSLSKGKNIYRITNTSVVDDISINKIVRHDDVHDGFEIIIILEGTPYDIGPPEKGGHFIRLTTLPVGFITSNLILAKHKVDGQLFFWDAYVSDPPVDLGFAPHKHHHIFDNTFNNLTFQGIEVDLIGSHVPDIKRGGYLTVMANFNVEVSSAPSERYIEIRLYHNTPPAVPPVGLVKTIKQTLISNTEKQHISLEHTILYLAGDTLQLVGILTNGSQTVTVTDPSYTEISNSFDSPGIYTPMLYAAKMAIKLKYNGVDDMWEEISRTNLDQT